MTREATQKGAFLRSPGTTGDSLTKSASQSPMRSWRREGSRRAAVGSLLNFTAAELHSVPSRRGVSLSPFPGTKGVSVLPCSPGLLAMSSLDWLTPTRTRPESEEC